MSRLYIVATPIGNLEDITLRALKILKSVDTILCEDTRITSRLLQKYEILDKKLLKYNDHSNDRDREKILNLVKKEEEVALVSDAGTPNICDPGQVLVKYLSKNNISIMPIPGCSSPIAALSCCVLDVDRFMFLGFLPTSKQKIINLISIIDKQTSFIFFERSSRIIKSLILIKDILQNRNITIAREITKIYEEFITLTIAEMIDYLSSNPSKLKGEFVVIIEKGGKKTSWGNESALKEVDQMHHSGLKSKEITKIIAAKYNINKKLVYDYILKIKK